MKKTGRYVFRRENVQDKEIERQIIKINKLKNEHITMIKVCTTDGY